MRVLLVTGKLASDTVKRYSKGFQGIETDVLVLDYPIASLIPLNYLRKKLKEINLKKYDLIILPGLINWNTKGLEEEFGIPIRKGTEEAADIPDMLRSVMEGVELSTEKSANYLISCIKRKKFREVLEAIPYSTAFHIGDLPIPVRGPPVRVFLELKPDTPIDKIRKEIGRLREFVDVFIVGTSHEANDTSYVREAVGYIVREGLRAGIDSSSVRELEAGIEAGAEIVLNLNEENIEYMTPFKDKTTFVVAPSRPMGIEEFVGLVRRVEEKGFSRIILDPILSPPLKGFVDSLLVYKGISSALPKYPMMMGFLNVTQLMDADSVGMNALLSVLAVELGVSCVLTMEGGKTKWSSWETRRGLDMSSVAHFQKRFPRDLGVDLLILKDKHRSEEMDKGEVEKVVYIDKGPESIVLDRAGNFVIYVNNREIRVRHQRAGETVEFRSTNALSLGREILRHYDISKDHAMYLGYELAKAEIASRLDKVYRQDSPVFKTIPENE